jgi:hypothetical protein
LPYDLITGLETWTGNGIGTTNWSGGFGSHMHFGELEFKRDFQSIRELGLELVLDLLDDTPWLFFLRLVFGVLDFRENEWDSGSFGTRRGSLGD